MLGKSQIKITLAVMLSISGIGKVFPMTEKNRVPTDGTISLGDAMEAAGQMSFGQQQQRKKERERKLRTLDAVWLYDDDEEARKLVDGDGKYCVYRSQGWRNENNLGMYGLDYAEAAAPELAESPLELCEAVIAGMPEEKRKAYQKMHDDLCASGNDTKMDWYGLYGRMVRDAAMEKRKLKQQRKTIEQGLDALIAGWEKQAPYQQTSRQRAVTAFGETWAKAYETAPAQTRDSLAAQAYEQHLGQTDWETYKKSRVKHIDSLKTIAETEKQAYQTQQEQDQKKQRRKTYKLAGRASVIAAAIGIISALLLSIKRRAATWQLPEWASLLTAILLAIAILGGESWFRWLGWSHYDLPLGYYTILRLTVTATAILLTYQAARAKSHPLIILLWASIALLFQPLIRVELEKEAWLTIDIILMIILLIRKSSKASNNPQNPKTH